MDGIIAHFRGGSQKRHYQMIVVVPGVESKEKAAELIGKQVTWSAPGKLKKQIHGVISQTHGNKGAVRVRFETGMPGQSLGQEVKIQ